MADVNNTSLKTDMNQVLVAIFSCIIILSAYFIFSIYQQKIEATQEEIVGQLSIASAAAANEITETELITLLLHHPDKDDIHSNDQDSVYLSIHNKLKKVAQIGKLESPIYILTYDQERESFLFVATSADQPYYLHEYTDYPCDLLDYYETGGHVIDYATKNGEWISAFSPIRSKSGRTLAIVHADYDYSTALSQARKKVISNILISLTVIVGLSLVLYRFVIIMVRRTGKVQRMLIAKNREIINKNEEVRAQHEEIASQNESISETNKALERTKKIVEEKNLLLEDANRFLDQKVKERTKALEEAIENLDNFLYRSYHDILGPVATLKGLCNVSLIEIENPEARAYLEKINMSVDKLRQTIKNINAVYEIKNRHFKREEINLSEMVQHIIKKQQYLLGKDCTKLNIDLPTDVVVNTDKFFLDLLMSDIIKNIVYFSAGEDASTINFSTSSGNNGSTTIFINDHGSRQIFRNAYFQFHEKDALNVNHDLFLFHNALKKLDCRITNYQNKDKSQTMELVIPNHDS